jgi:subtilase family serine protease
LNVSLSLSEYDSANRQSTALSSINYSMQTHSHTLSAAIIIGIILSASLSISVERASASAVPISPIDAFEARPPIHIMAGTTAGPAGLFPYQVKKAYGLPTTGGAGTIAIISAYHHPNIESDLAVFDKAFGLVACTVKNGCLEIHRMGTGDATDSGWSTETALDTEWSHAIAPKAKILVVEATSASGSALLKAVDYARSRKDMVAVSMSWGGNEFAGETALDSHFTANSSTAQNSAVTASPMAFFASSGDDGAGASWPAASPNVISVGGTSLSLKADGSFMSEKAWNGSGGGVSAYENEPAYEKNYSIPKAQGKRTIPDVAYAADPAHGFSVYHAPDAQASKASPVKSSSKYWYVVGGTSAGAPQWAAIASLGYATKRPISLGGLYGDKASTGNASFFRDIKSGTNGDCTYYCSARAHYDYVTGLGSPMTYKF